MHQFRTAVEARDLEAVSATLAADVTFYSPVAFKPYHGRELVSAILRHVIVVLEGLTYVREIGAGGSDGLALVFTATVNGREAQGCDFLTFNEAGEITELTVMIRPLSAATAVAERMAVEYEAIKAELGL